MAAGQYGRALQVLATGNLGYGIALLLSCCQLEPGNLLYRQALRQAQQNAAARRPRGRWLAWLRALPARIHLLIAQRARNHLKVLEYGEQVLTALPGHAGSQLAMAQAAEALGMDDLAVWVLEEARPRDAGRFPVHRALARLYERRHNLTGALAVWERLARALPADSEARQQLKDLAVRDTIARGGLDELTAPDPVEGF